MVQNRVGNGTVVGERKPHADSASGDFAKKFAVNEVAPAAPGVGERCKHKAKVQPFPHLHLVALEADVGENRSEDHATVVAHSRNTRKVVAERIVGHRENDFGRVREIVARLVEEHVAEARTDNDACDNPGEQAVELVLGVAQLFFLVHVHQREVARHEGENVHDAVPAHREAPERKGCSVKIRRDEVPPSRFHFIFLVWGDSGEPSS